MNKFYVYLNRKNGANTCVNIQDDALQRIISEDQNVQQKKESFSQ